MSSYVAFPKDPAGDRDLPPPPVPPPVKKPVLGLPDRAASQGKTKPKSCSVRQVFAAALEPNFISIYTKMVVTHKDEPSPREGEEGLRPLAPVKPQRNRKAMSYDAGTFR